MKTSEAIKITHTLSCPSKMPGWSYGLPAKECKTGSKLRLVKGSTCYNCYALKGCYVFPVVKEAQKITGSMTRTSKMPGLSYSLPAWECQTGAKLRKIPGTHAMDAMH